MRLQVRIMLRTAPDVDAIIQAVPDLMRPAAVVWSLDFLRRYNKARSARADAQAAAARSL